MQATDTMIDIGNGNVAAKTGNSLILSPRQSETKFRGKIWGFDHEELSRLCL